VNRFLEIGDVPTDAVLVDARTLEQFQAGHLPGARHAEFMDKFLTRTPDQRQALNDAVQRLARGLGLRGGERVVVYDAGRDVRAARLAWALEYAHFQVALLRHGLIGYTGALETNDTAVQHSDFILEQPRTELLATADDILGRGENVVVVDARAAEEFSGEKTIPGTNRAGHIPGALNLDWQRLTDADGIADDAALEAQLSAIPDGADVIVHCQSGARSSVVYHALKSKGARVRNYVGSMNEWGGDEALPLEKDA
jgi:thiosulfate/3-mercaptopyruvate sulfurtransferase